jgi:hypothetical protein
LVAAAIGVMAKHRNSSRFDFLHDESLTVATQAGLFIFLEVLLRDVILTNGLLFADILFNPLENGGQRFLQLRTLKLEQWKRELNTDKSYELDTPEDTQYLRGLEPTDWKVIIIILFYINLLKDVII